jgi:hypothetical protein
MHLSSLLLKSPKVRGSPSEASAGKNVRPYLKNNWRKKKAGEVTQAVEYLWPWVHTPVPSKKKKKEGRKERKKESLCIWVGGQLRLRFELRVSCLHTRSGTFRVVWPQMVSCLQCRHSITWAMPPVHFAVVILEMGFCALFPQAGFEPQSWS